MNLVSRFQWHLLGLDKAAGVQVSATAPLQVSKITDTPPASVANSPVAGTAVQEQAKQDTTTQALDRLSNGAQRYREGDLRKRALTAPDAALAGVLLHPDFGYWVSMSEAFRRRAIDAGYTATLAVAPALRALHAG